ncbi:MAG: pseudouridine synthase [Candidatus Omnitrophota bacterium]
MKKEEQIYLHLAIAKSGYCSRRKAEKLTRESKVTVNNLIVTCPEHKIDLEKDIIAVNGKRIKFEEKKVYFLLNKPKGILSAAEDKHKKTVIDLLPPDVRERIYPVGRLDKDTTGILILTNDGDLTYRLTHPKFKVFKTYLVLCQGEVKKEDTFRLENGIEIEGGKTAPAKIKNLACDKKEDKTSLLIEIYEGRKRQVKKMFGEVKHPVIELERVEYGGLTLGDLKRGELRSLSETEVKHLKQKAGLSK